MERELRVLWLDALNCNWSVTRTVECSILTCTWFFADERIVGLTGLLSHINLGKFGGDVSVNFWVGECMIGEQVKIFSRSENRSLATLRSMSASAPLKLNQEFSLHGIHQTGFLSAEELGVFTKLCASLDTTSRLLSTISYEAGTQILGTLIEFQSTLNCTVNDL